MRGHVYVCYKPIDCASIYLIGFSNCSDGVFFFHFISDNNITMSCIYIFFYFDVELLFAATVLVHEREIF